MLVHKKTTSGFRIIIRRYMPHHRGSTWPASLPAASGIATVARVNVAAWAAIRCSSAVAALVLPCLSLLASCHSQLSVPEPSIEFTRIPPATESGVDKLDVIEGRVIG